jgi:hypothetical protein
MEKMSELKRDLAKGNEIIVRFGNDLEKCKSDLQKYQQELAKSREKVIPLCQDFSISSFYFFR